VVLEKNLRTIPAAVLLAALEDERCERKEGFGVLFSLSSAPPMA
jgi:hypothetical protein